MNKRRIISLILSLIMVLSVYSIVPLSASTEETEVADTGATSGVTGNCTWELNGTELTISSDIATMSLS
jgi:hypothetical protein